MLKKANSGRTGGGVGGGQAEMRLLKVKEVLTDGMVVEYVDGKAGPATVFLEAMPNFVAQKHNSANFLGKPASGNAMSDRFYLALMRPTSNPEHAFQKNLDIISAKIFPRAGTKTVDGYGEIPKNGLGGGFTIFARADSQKPDAFDPSVMKFTKADLVIQGFGRIVHDKEADNAQTGKKGSSWLEVLTQRGNLADMNDFADEVRDLVKQKRGKTVFVRIVDAEGNNEFSVSFYPGKAAADVEQELEEIRNLNYPNERIFVWDVQSRIYLRDEFLVGQGDTPSKLERFRRDAAFIYKIDPAKTPFEVDATDVKVRGETKRLPGKGFLIPIAVSQTMFQNASTDSQWLPGAIRALVPTGNEALPSEMMFMTPHQRTVALEAAAANPAMDDAPEAMDQGMSAPAAPAAVDKDLDFGFGEEAA